MVSEPLAIFFQAGFSALLWAIPIYVAYIVLDRLVSRLTRSAPKKIIIFYAFTLFILAIFRTIIVSQAVWCPPSVNNVDMQTIENTCNYWWQIAVAFLESVLKSAYLSVIFLFSALCGYTLYRWLPFERPLIRGYVGTVFSILITILILAVFPWVIAGFVSSSLW